MRLQDARLLGTAWLDRPEQPTGRPTAHVRTMIEHTACVLTSVSGCSYTTKAHGWEYRPASHNEWPDKKGFNAEPKAFGSRVYCLAMPALGALGKPAQHLDQWSIRWLKTLLDVGPGVIAAGNNGDAVSQHMHDCDMHGAATTKAASTCEAGCWELL